MQTTTITARDFNQDTSRAKKAAALGPVVITDRGTPSHVLLTYQDYEQLAGRQASLTELLANPQAADIEFEPGVVPLGVRPANLD